MKIKYSGAVYSQRNYISLVNYISNPELGYVVEMHEKPHALAVLTITEILTRNFTVEKIVSGHLI